MNSGSVSGTEDVGGLIGRGNNTTTITNSMNSGSVSGTEDVGGLIGYGGNNTITNSMNSGSVSGSVSGTSNLVGGLIGNGSINTITNSMNSGSVSGTRDVGGLIGNGSNNTITNSMNSGSVSGTSRVGGLIGSGQNTITITNSMNSGSVSGTSSNVGGLIGLGQTTITITNSMNSGSVSGTQYVGGLIGNGNKTTITNSMNSGSVSGTQYVGGLICYADSQFSQLFIYYSINFGSVIATSNTTAVGGITGFLPTTNDIEQTYYSGTITSNGLAVDGVAFGTKVTDLTTFNLAFFTTTLGWDTEMWDFTGLDIANGVYPTLKNMPVVEE